MHAAAPERPGTLITPAGRSTGGGVKALTAIQDVALISVGGSPPGTVAATTDEAWRSAFESVFLGAVRLARVLAADLGGTGDGGAATGGWWSAVFGGLLLTRAQECAISRIASSTARRRHGLRRACSVCTRGAPS